MTIIAKLMIGLFLVVGFSVVGFFVLRDIKERRICLHCHWDPKRTRRKRMDWTICPQCGKSRYSKRVEL